MAVIWVNVGLKELRRIQSKATVHFSLWMSVLRFRATSQSAGRNKTLIHPGCLKQKGCFSLDNGSCSPGVSSISFEKGQFLSRGCSFSGYLLFSAILFFLHCLLTHPDSHPPKVISLCLCFMVQGISSSWYPWFQIQLEQIQMPGDQEGTMLPPASPTKLTCLKNKTHKKADAWRKSPPPFFLVSLACWFAKPGCFEGVGEKEAVKTFKPASNSGCFLLALQSIQPPLGLPSSARL